MSQLTPKDAFQQLLAQRPELEQKYAAFLEAVDGNDQLPASLLALCRARIEQIHGIEPDYPDAGILADLVSGQYNRFSESEQAALKIAERIPYQHHQIEDDRVEEVRRLIGNTACVALLTALSFCDVTCRLNQTLGGLNVD